MIATLEYQHNWPTLKLIQRVMGKRPAERKLLPTVKDMKESTVDFWCILIDDYYICRSER